MGYIKLCAIALALTFVLLPSLSLADELVFMGIKNRIVDRSFVEISITANIDEPTDNMFVLQTLHNVEGLKYSANFDGLTCNSLLKHYGSDIVCDVSGANSTKKTFFLSYGTRDLVADLNDKYSFKHDIIAPMNIRSLSLEVSMPEAAGLTEDDTSFIPTDGEKSSDGRLITVFWKRANLTKGQIFTSQVNYEFFVKDDPVYLVVSAVAVLGAIGAFVYFRRTRTPAPDISSMFPVLKSDEKLVMDSVLNHGSGVNQKVVVKESGYSKAKVSKVLKSLQERGFIKLERIGRGNRIHVEDVGKKDKIPDLAEDRELDKNFENSDKSN